MGGSSTGLAATVVAHLECNSAVHHSRRSLHHGHCCSEGPGLRNQASAEVLAFWQSAQPGRLDASSS
ncbi:hypothetical protein WJX81_006938 [Elliptochloris bilobata]|uniref:Uncharacterized protein n=1 Tax=Elliptochloris bilobata TaxID=381761 RepID=A0AAW1SI63_9CHLO